ncbi:MAG: 4Fe-4S dicluster domain-containing protein [Phycisphaerae bacterium]|nr:4Fe-4S dicluster domain-containing protein [Phycisphaerae bacterium]
MSKRLIVDPDQCTSCRLCELACSQLAVGAYQPSRSHIQVLIHADDAFFFPLVCIQCEDAACMDACPTEALVRDPDTNAVVVVEENCTECGLCVTACPYGAIRCFDGRAFKCELCGGDPECVKYCSPGALRYESEDSWSPEQRKAYAAQMQDLAEEVLS